MIPEEYSSESLENAKKEAAIAAFQSVRQKLNLAANLDTLEQIKQATALTSANKQAFLKARVQGLVTNIETGISDLQSCCKSLADLEKAVKQIESESKNMSMLIPHFEDLKTLSTLWDRLTTIENLTHKFEDSDHLINLVTQFFEKNPTSFSIECYNAIEYLLSIREDFLTNTQSPELVQWIDEHFQCISNAKIQLFDNITKYLENLFSVDEVDPDPLVRAIWILTAEGEGNQIEHYLTISIKFMFTNIINGTTENNLEETLQKITDKVCNLPEQIGSIIDALPSEIKTLDLINICANDNILLVIQMLRSQCNNSAFWLKTLYLWVENTTKTLRVLLGVEPSQDLIDLKDELRQDFITLMPREFTEIANRILSIDDSEVEEDRSHTTYTMAPSDFIKALEDGYSVAVSMGINALLPEIAVGLVQAFADILINYADMARNSNNLYHLSAIVNNCINALESLKNAAVDSPDLFTEVSIKQIKSCWSEIQKAAMARIQALILEGLTAGEVVDLRLEFPSRFKDFKSRMDELHEHLIGPLYKKLLKQILTSFLPIYMTSYASKSPNDNVETFSSLVSGDIGEILEYYNRIRSEDPTLGSFIETIITPCEKFRSLMIEPNEENYHLFYLGIKKIYTDFTPEIAVRLMECRPKTKRVPKEYTENFYKVGQNVQVKPTDKNFETIINIMNQPKFAEAGKKIIDKLKKKKDDDDQDYMY